MERFFATPIRPREALAAVLLATLASLAVLGSAVLPTRALVPFAPERYQPLRAEHEAAGTLDAAELGRGSPAMGDRYNQSLAWDRILQDRLRSGGLPLWTRDLGSGAPFVPQMAQPYQPWSLLLLLPYPSVALVGLRILLHHVLFGASAWWFLRRLGLSHPGACFGLVLAELGLWTQARTHHDVMLTAALPIFALWSTIAGGFRAAHDGDRFGIARVGLVALLLGSSWNSGFAPIALQVTALTIGFAGTLALGGVAGPRRRDPLLATGAGILLAALLAVPQMLPTLLAALRSSRGPFAIDDLCAVAIPGAHLGFVAWPDALQPPTIPTDRPSWIALATLPPAAARDGNWPETAFAFGLAALLSPLGWLTRTRLPRGTLALAGFWLVVAVLCLLLAFGVRAVVAAVAVLPGTTVGLLQRYLFGFVVAAIPLCALGAERLAAARGIRVAAGAVALGIVAQSLWAVWPAWTLADAPFAAAQAAAMATNPHIDVPADVIRAQIDALPGELAANRALQWEAFGRTALIGALAAAALFALRGRRLLWTLAALAAVELVAIGHGIVVSIAPDRLTTPPATLGPALAATRDAERAERPRPRFARLEDPGDQGFRDLLPPNLAAFHGLEDLFAYAPLPPQRSAELLSALEPGTDIVLPGVATVGFFRPATLASPWLDLLGVEYVLAEARQLPGDGRFVDVSPPAAGARVRLWRRSAPPWPRATFVDRAVVVDDRDQRLAALATADAAALRTRVVLEDWRSPTATGDGVPEADVELLLHRDERVVVRVTNAEPGYLRLADPYDPGWVATIDGRPAPVFAADHVCRAVFLESPGEHVVEFRYAATEVVWPPRLGGWAATAAAALVVIGLAVGRRRRPQCDAALAPHLTDSGVS